MADAMVHHQRLRSLILVLIERLDVSRMWASLLHLKAIDKDNLQRMEAKKTQSEQVLALIAHLERGYPNRLYKFLRACHLTGQTDILDLFGVDAELYMPGTMSSSNNFTYLRSMSETIKEEENVYCAFTEVAQPQGQSPGDTYRAGGVRTWRVGEGGSTITCLCWMTRHQLLVSSGYDRKVWQMTFKADVKSLMSLQLLDKYCGFWVSSMSRCRNSGELALVAWSDQCIYLDIDPDNPKTVNNNLERWEPSGVGKPDQVSLGHPDYIAVLPVHSQCVHIYDRRHKELVYSKHLVQDCISEGLPTPQTELLRFALSKDERVAATTTDHRLVIGSLSQSWVIPVGGKGHSKGRLFAPESVCIAQDGFVYVANKNPGRVSVFSQRSGWYVCDVHIEIGETQSVTMDMLLIPNEPPRLALGLDYGVVKLCKLYKTTPEPGETTEVAQAEVQASKPGKGKGKGKSSSDKVPHKNQQRKGHKKS